MATTRNAEPATCSPAVCSTRAMITVHRFAVKKKFATKPNSDPTNSVTKPTVTSLRNDTKSPNEP